MTRAVSHLDVPAARYRPSLGAYPERLPPLEYAPADLLRRIQAKGIVHLHGHLLRLPEAFRPTIGTAASPSTSLPQIATVDLDCRTGRCIPCLCTLGSHSRV